MHYWRKVPRALKARFIT